MIFRSPYPDVPVPDVALHRFVLAGAAERADQPALIDGPSGRALTYGQLAAGVERLAAGLTARGFRRGDVLALFMPNLPEFALALHVTLASGGVVTTVTSLATVQDAEYQLRNAGARFLVTVAPFLDRAAPAAAQVGIEQLFVVGEARGVTPFGALLEAGGSAPRPSLATARDLAVLPYSSGTTGFPKGVMLTHRNLVANLIQTATVHHVVAADRIIAVLPFFHIYGMQVVMNLALWQGATLVTMPRFELEPFLALLEAHRITRAFVVPPLVLALANDPAVDRYDVSSLRGVMSGAAPLDAALEAACARRLSCALIQGYGLTEASPVTHAVSDEPGAARPGSIGPLLPNTECRVVDPASGSDLGPGEDGELWIRGPQVMSGYLNNPEATAATLDAAGWLHTGHRPRGSGRVLHDRGPSQGADQVQGLPGAARRARGDAADPSGGGRCRRHPHPRRGVRRGAQGLRGVAARRAAGGAPGLRRRARRTVQEDPRRGSGGCDSAVTVRKDPAARTEATRAGRADLSAPDLIAVRGSAFRSSARSRADRTAAVPLPKRAAPAGRRRAPAPT